ncbi:PREDICTED: glutamate receptor ionotropic, kainate 2-like [Ceratosolen solmsi marchali]|uniref:Glutamate receptor ionotropic, kainate 2-like n=1 Tax=Ceratosolen solmsi marchali TaxID=326594 RepID=A0AAJ7DZD5_9HYME|nr:PREDICTED: glutamate receptor ionotropic, kainate 2-like [Ceratosolen solmsi marchali]
MLMNLQDDSTSLFSTVLTSVTAFDCSTDDDRFQLLRTLSKTFLPSNVLNIRQNWNRVREIAWEFGYEGQDIPGDAHQLLLILNLDCPDSKEFLYRLNREMLFAAPFKWLMDIYPDSEVIIWRQSTGQVLSIYWTGSSGRYIIEDRGYWIWETKRLVVKDKNIASRRRKNLAGAQLKSCIVITNPDTINHLTDYQDRHIDSITKCNYPWVLHLVNILNATVTFKQTNTWGYQNSNGSWGGMIGMLQRDEIDFGGTGSFLVKERIGVIQYIALSTPTGIRFIFRRPPLSSISNLFKLPFRNSVWFSICALIILLVILQYPAMRLEWFQSINKQHEREPYPPNLSDDLLVIVGAVSQQGSWYEPRSVSTRIIVLMSLMAALNLYAAYTANIVALLQSTTTSIKSLKDLLESPLTLAAHDNVYNRYYFKSFKDPVRRAIFEERIEPRGTHKTNWYAIEDGIERIRHGQFAFHVELGCAYKIIQETFAEDEKCGFHEIDYFNVFDPHFIVRRRSPYLELLRVGGLLLQESGLRTRELTRLYTKKPVCSSSNRFLSVGLTECYGAFLTLFFGLLLAFGIFFTELLYIHVYVYKSWIQSSCYALLKFRSVQEKRSTLSCKHNIINSPC